MACIEKIYSVSAVIGNGACNGKCAFCAGSYLRPQAVMSPAMTNGIYWKNYASAIKLCARYGGWSLSLTSSGEPTVDPRSVTKALEVYSECAAQGAYMPNVNLFTNGILLGDPAYCNEWLPKWKALGLTNIAVSVHSVDRWRQGEAYGIHTNPNPHLSSPIPLELYKYPRFEDIFNNVRKHGIGVRTTLLLRRGEVDGWRSYSASVDRLIAMGSDNITSWPVGAPDGSRTQYTPSRWGLASIRMWLKFNAKLCHGHVWGGGVYDYDGAILRLTDYVTKHDPDLDFVRQLVVFQDGTVAYSWIKDGALCMK
jgi:hypothetical protein